MAVSNGELMEELAEMNFKILQGIGDGKDTLDQRHRAWKQAKNVVKHFNISLGTVKNW